MRVIRFTVNVAPEGKARPRFYRRGNFVAAYTPKKTVTHEKMIYDAAAIAMLGRDLFVGAVGLSVKAFMPIPKSWSQKKRYAAMGGTLRPTGKPDIDNILKAIGDGMNNVVWADDKQIVTAHIEKFYSEKPRIEIMVEGE